MYNNTNLLLHIYGYCSMEKIQNIVSVTFTPIDKKNIIYYNLFNIQSINGFYMCIATFK